MWFLMLIAAGAAALSSLLVGPAIVKLVQQVRDREEHLDDGSVVVVYVFVIGLSFCIALGLGSSLLTSVPLIITGCLAPSTALELAKALRDRKELNKVSKGFLHAFFICFGLTITIELWLRYGYY